MSPDLDWRLSEGFPGNWRENGLLPVLELPDLKTKQNTFLRFYAWQTRNSTGNMNTKSGTYQMAGSLLLKYLDIIIHVSSMFERHRCHLWLVTKGWKVHFGTSAYGTNLMLCIAVQTEREIGWFQATKRNIRLLLGNRNLTLKTVISIYPDTLLLTPTAGPLHDCLQMIEQTHTSRPALTDVSLENPLGNIYQCEQF